MCRYLKTTDTYGKNVFKGNKMSNFEVQIVADSINPTQNRVTTFLLTYPRFIHSEVMTHRVFSRNAASSRAIPINKIIEQIQSNPAMPVRWGKNGKGMQDHGKLDDVQSNEARSLWIDAAKSAIESAQKLQQAGLHKQIVNRVLEPFMWMTTLVTATEWENFFSLRLHRDAQPEFQHLSYIMLKKYLTNQPAIKTWGDWHIPFGDNIEGDYDLITRLKIATARAARTSYLTITNTVDVKRDMELHDTLAQSGHWSPFEHSCFAVHHQVGNFKGWRQYRHTFSEENRKCDLNKLLEDYEHESL